MAITCEVFGDVLVAHAPEEVVDDTMSPFTNELSNMAERGQKRIVLQLDQSDTFDSAGLTTLLDFQDSLLELGGHLKLSGLTEVGETIFSMTRLDECFDICESVIDAVQSCQSQ
ncbi:STAS domain-containing protein [Calycomorphotria hydatis]|uniref:STAS domain-containing protein n=1 Tax=Calycomorphotria hydatis TaxID=2528027 RepID=A0A517TB49_9PLAN|nr:STAS domain-containing protein [Calycomorphotria hydatis]QDT65597.1 hypothetical protein V22_28530 [Calycomorphotria hydatis]